MWLYFSVSAAYSAVNLFTFAKIIQKAPKHLNQTLTFDSCIYETITSPKLTPFNGHHNTRTFENGNSKAEQNNNVIRIDPGDKHKLQS